MTLKERTLQAKRAWRQVARLIEDLCHTHVSHTWLNHLDACAGRCPGVARLWSTYKKRFGNRSYTVRESQLAGTMVLPISLKIRIVTFVSSQRLPELRAGTSRKRKETAFIIHKNLVMLFWRITKFSMKKTILVCSIVTQSWCRVFILIGFNATLRRITLHRKP